MIKFIKRVSTIIGLVALIVTSILYIISIKEKLFISHSKPELRYRIKFFQILDREKIQPNSYGEWYLQCKNKDNEIRNMHIANIQYFEIEIKNIGNKIMTSNDMHKNNPLRITDCYNLIGACIARQTPSYIGARLDDTCEGCDILIKFDRINQNDSVFIKLLFYRNSYFDNHSIGVLGSSDYFNPNIKSLDE